MIMSLLPAWLEARICLRLRQHGLNSVYLVQCLFLLHPLFLCVAYGCAVVDEKDHTVGAIHYSFPLLISFTHTFALWQQLSIVLVNWHLFYKSIRK
jgi:hypothetical protein